MVWLDPSGTIANSEKQRPGKEKEEAFKAAAAGLFNCFPRQTRHGIKRRRQFSYLSSLSTSPQAPPKRHRYNWVCRQLLKIFITRNSLGRGSSSKRRPQGRGNLVPKKGLRRICFALLLLLQGQLRVLGPLVWEPSA